jgi:uncharacterized protein YceH (UPF0502 family)
MVVYFCILEGIIYFMENQLPLLSAEEQRVLGTLLEKSKTTPDYYPMTVNALAAGCNQKTSRRPVVDYDEQTVLSTINSLKALGLLNTAVGGGSRVLKYKHNFSVRFTLSDAEEAILCLLLLRGPQTPGELNTNSGRMYEFSSLESVLESLNNLAQAEPPFVKALAKQPGQKEGRYVHLFGESHVPDEEESHSEAASRPSVSDLEARVTVLEQELAELKEKLAGLLS